MFLIVFITALGYPLYAPLDFAWNPGFAILFHILAVIGLYYWKETNKTIYLYCVGIIIALGVQSTCNCNSTYYNCSFVLLC